MGNDRVIYGSLTFSSFSCSYFSGSSWRICTFERRNLQWKCTIPAGKTDTDYVMASAGLRIGQGGGHGVILAPPPCMRKKFQTLLAGRTYSSVSTELPDS